MLGLGGTVWLGIVVVAILNGAVRDILLVPPRGDLLGLAIRCVTLAGLILLVTWIGLRWIHPASMADAWSTSRYEPGDGDVLLAAHVLLSIHSPRRRTSPSPACRISVRLQPNSDRCTSITVAQDFGPASRNADLQVGRSLRGNVTV